MEGGNRSCGHGRGGVVDCFGAEGAARAVALALSRGLVTHKRVGRVKGAVRSRDKRRRV
jgi:hypothetical protein